MASQRRRAWQSREGRSPQHRRGAAARSELHSLQHRPGAGTERTEERSQPRPSGHRLALGQLRAASTVFQDNQEGVRVHQETESKSICSEPWCHQRA
ncbi:putative protein FAM157A [Sapajus apella]|uniref:Uncharacterized protein n=1 Tax=Sapajus apella TaxID=9515 RepID=A0A6J3GS00_SAPAP|nr:putative protein FAM157A [Sapajus apella]XP_032120642.1 putative protein FAM157A [Sapajus apella]